MSKLSIDQKTIKELLSSNKSDFLVPNYQRPYAWTEDECATLWDDIFAFAIPEEGRKKFDAENEEYFLGPIVTFRNSDSKLEVIDGQQRLTTIMLLLRAFYTKFEYMKDEQSMSTRDTIAKCIWKTDEFEKPNMDLLKIDSKVASDDDKEEFLELLRTGNTSNEQKSKYSKAFAYFQERIQRLVNEYPTYTALLATRILNNIILLPIEAENQNSALRIFSTLNDRGLPLSDADIFKSQLYKFYSDIGEEGVFIQRWKRLEETCASIFKSSSGNPMVELFTRYMYFERAKQGNSKTTTISLRDFFAQNEYSLLRTEDTLINLEALTQFWKSVDDQEGFSDRILKRLFVLNYAPNGMWTYLTSVYFLHNKDSNGNLEEDSFYSFLTITNAFIWAYAIEKPGVNALRTPVYPEMVNTVNGKMVSFERFRFDRSSIKKLVTDFQFTNGRPITKSMLAWWVYTNENELLSLETVFEIEHIYARRRAEQENLLVNIKNLEALGNKALLEKRINARATDYSFSDKRKHYRGFTDTKNNYKEGTNNKELVDIAETSDTFSERDIEDRTQRMVDAFIEFLNQCDLLEAE